MRKAKDGRKTYQEWWNWILGVIVSGYDLTPIVYTAHRQKLHQILTDDKFWLEVERIEELVWGPVVYE